MKRLFTILLLCIPLSSNARIHTVLDEKTIAKYQASKILERGMRLGVNIKAKLNPRNKSFINIVSAAANKHNVDEKLVHAVIQAESSYDPTAVSNKGAVGLMQLMPDTAKRFGVVDRNNPTQNVNGGTKYLKYLIKLFGNNLPLVVAAYNAGENAVIKYHNSIPPYPDTKVYVKQVLALYRS